jgi:hypothetical protein
MSSMRIQIDEWNQEDCAGYERKKSIKIQKSWKIIIWNKQLNIPNKNLNQKVVEQNGVSWKYSVRNSTQSGRITSNSKRSWKKC